MLEDPSKPDLDIVELIDESPRYATLRVKRLPLFGGRLCLGNG